VNIRNLIRKSVGLLLIVLAGSIAAAANPTSLQSRLTFEQHAAKVRSKLKGRGFTVIVERPFVVIGDEPRANVAEWAEQVVRGTVTRLKKDYFAKDPEGILEIWLLKDEASYRKHAKEFLSDEPDTSYGYYLPSKHALIMNIATGGGTLVHEIVHPFVEANFPKAPAWFNEGLGSLYEQSGSKDGRIYGFTNWRLAGLQSGLKKGTVPSFETLTSMSRSEFYREATGTNYSQARYLCYYLQEKGLLREFYREFSMNVSSDPTGYLSLKKVLGESDMAGFQRKWEQFVLDLRYP
jgi:hypothetical protein